VLQLHQRVDPVRQLLVPAGHLHLRPGFFGDESSQLEFLLRVEVTQVFALLVLQDAEEVARVNLKVSAKTLAQKGHQLLEVAKLRHGVDHLRVLHPLQILF